MDTSNVAIMKPLEELQARLCVDIQIHLLNEHFNKHWVIGQKNNILEMCTTYWLIGQMNNLKKQVFKA
jgi:hypothetical protein